MNEDMDKFRNLMDDYWDVAFTQGWERRKTDDEDNSAQKAEIALMVAIRTALADARREALEDAAEWHDGRVVVLTKLAGENSHYVSLFEKLTADAEKHKWYADAIRALKEKGE